MALNNSQYESIIKRYDQTRDRNHRIHVERLSTVYRKIPGFHSLDASVGSTALIQAKLLLDGNDGALQEFRQKVSDISAKKRSMLSAEGFPEDYLNPIYDCHDCHDTGYITGLDGVRRKCHCFVQQEIDILYDQSNIKEQLQQDNFSTLSYDYYSGNDLELFQRAVEKSKLFVQNFKQDYHNLIFYGTVGVGKSFLSGCIASEILEKGNSVIYFSAVGLFDRLARLNFDSKSRESMISFCEDIYNCDLLIIDDLGTELTNSFVSTQLFSLINERHLRKKATIISTNLELHEIRDRYSDRIFSRITTTYDVCKLTGPDIRHMKRTNKIAI